MINRTLIEFRECILPSQILNHLINTRHTTRKIIFRDTKLKDVSNCTLNNKKLLSHLDLSGSKLLPDVWQMICSQMTNLIHLEHIDLSGNNLSQVSSLTLSNKHSLIHLNLSHTYLSSDMCQNVCVQLTHLTSLKYLILSGNNLSQVSFLILSNKTSLNYLDLKNTNMPKYLTDSVYKQIMNLESLETIYTTGCSISPTKCSIGNIDLPVGGELFQKVINRLVLLKHIDTKETMPRYCSSLLEGPDPGLLKLSSLVLDHRTLNKDNLLRLSYITHWNMLPNLQALYLSHNTLTGCLSNFLTDSHPGLPQLKKLYLGYTALKKDDLQQLLYITEHNKLPKLEELYLSGNTLTGYLSSFLPNAHPALPKLKKLDLGYTALNKEDPEHLAHITQNKKLPKLQLLNLSGTTFRGMLSSFLPDPHQILPELGELILLKTDLNKKDLKHLTHLIQACK